MALQKSLKNLRVHVLCCGVPYGNGEANEAFYDFFRRSWLSLHPKIASLPVIGDGKNVIPTLHVVDLAKTVKLLLSAQPKQQYFIVKD